MKKQLSFALLTASIFSLNILPVQSATNLDVDLDTLAETNESAAVTDSQWCVTVPYMGSLCWDL